MPQVPDPYSLTHYGILGMHWGFRKPEPIGTGRRDASNIELERANKKKAILVRKDLLARGVDEESFKKDYGPESFFKDHKKELIIGASVIGAAAVVGVAAYALRNTDLGSLLSTPTNLIFENNWHTDLELPVGSILTRASSQIEGAPRPDGFYAAFLKDDVLRYRAALSGIMPESGAFSNEYQSLVKVKAPSGFRTIELCKSLASKDSEFAKTVIDDVNFSRSTLDLSPERIIEEVNKGTDLNTLRTLVNSVTRVSDVSPREWQSVVARHARKWSVYPSGLEKTKFFEHLAANGYNAVIDFNNAGVIAKTPLRVFNGSDFKASKGIKLSVEDISKALQFYEHDPILHSSESTGQILQHNRTNISYTDAFGYHWNYKGSDI